MSAERHPSRSPQDDGSVPGLPREEGEDRRYAGHKADGSVAPRPSARASEDAASRERSVGGAAANAEWFQEQAEPGPIAPHSPPSTPEINPRCSGPVVEPAVQNRVVLLTDGVLHQQQPSRRRRHPGEQIQHQQLSISPLPGNADQTAQGRIITLTISSRGIQTHEKEAPFACTQAAPQPPAVTAIATEGRFRPRAVADSAQGCVRWRDHRQRG